MFRRLCLAFACVAAFGTSLAHAAPKIDVITTIKPVHSLMTNLMKDVAEPKLLIKDQTPFDYQPSTQDLNDLKKANLVIWIGQELESSLADTLNGASNALEMLSLGDAKILPLRNAQEGRDPYIWLDVRNVEVFVDALHERLVSIDSANEAIYQENRRKLKEEIAALDRQFEFGFRAVAAGQSWLYHDTQQYFEQSYAFKVRGTLAPKAGQDAETINMLKMRNELTDMGPVCFFIEEGLTQKNLPFAIENTQAKVAELKSFALGMEAGQGLYVKMMKHNFDTIAKCFADIGATYVDPSSRKIPE